MEHNFTFRPDTWDENIFNGIVIHNEYQLPEKLMPADICIDIGSHVGSFAYACHLRGSRNIKCYEAWEDNYNLTKKNHSTRPYVEANHAAVWRSDKEIDKLVFAPSQSSINTGAGNVWDLNNGQFEVPAVSLDKIIESAGRNIKYLKLDCEASEFPILLTSKLLHKVENICGEYHELGSPHNPTPIPLTLTIEGYEEYSIDVLAEFLEKKGFDVRHSRSRDSEGKWTNLGHFFAKKR